MTRAGATSIGANSAATYKKSVAATCSVPAVAMTWFSACAERDGEEAVKSAYARALTALTDEKPHDNRLEQRRAPPRLPAPPHATHCLLAVNVRKRRAARNPRPNVLEYGAVNRLGDRFWAQPTP